MPPGYVPPPERPEPVYYVDCGPTVATFALAKPRQKR